VCLRDPAETEDVVTIPIACSLTGPERRERARTVLATLRAHTRHVTERSDGYALELTTTDEAIAAATALIQLERRCCPFLRFTLTVEPAGGAVELALTGAPGAREFLSTWLAR
jgi:hypothetical protein